MASTQPDERRPLLGGHDSDHHDHESSNNSNSNPLLTIHHEGESHRSGFHPAAFLRITWRSSCTVSKYVNILWPVVTLAILLKLLTPTAHLWVFAAAYIAMIPAANLVGFAGQELARKMPKVAGILIETAFGGIVEIVLFMILIAKHRSPTHHHGPSNNNNNTTEEPGDADEGNLVPVIQAAILGSILTNLLLCLGLCFYFGGLRQQTQTFHAAVSEVGNGLLLVAGFGLLIPSAFFSALKGETVSVKTTEGFTIYAAKFTREQLTLDVQRISQITSVILILSFVVYVLYNARSQQSIFDEVLEADEHKDTDHAYDIAKAKYTFTECCVALVLSLALVTLLAYILVEEIEEVVSEGGVPDQFLGIVLLPLVEKAAEHLTAIDEAWDGQMNFALYHCLGPSIQTALFNAPLVVLVGWALGKPDMDLNFEIFEAVLLVLAILVVGQFLRDGQSNYLEGALLVAVYFVIAVAAWFYPDPEVATSN
jgi:Ca2+:H+ antiporter